MQKRHLFLLTILASSCLSSVYAARPLDVKNQPAILQAITTQSNLKTINTEMDFNQTTHVRLKQTYQGYPVWGGDVVMHYPKMGSVTQNGLIWEDLAADLNNTPTYIFKSEHAARSLRHVTGLFQSQTGLKMAASGSEANLMVYVDDENKAHWVYLISFLVKPVHAMPIKPTWLVDAVTFKVYQHWDDIQTLDEPFGGGFGGNPKMGKLIYDGLLENLPKLNIKRDSSSQLCYLQNTEVTVKDMRKQEAVVQYTCTATDTEHNNVYWNGDQDAVNGAYSPSNDALYVGAVVKGMYQNWYDIPVLVENGKPMMLNMRVHDDVENAYWDGKQMTFGDGGSMFYPLVSLGVGAHEVSHGFTQQHSGLKYFAQSGGLNESFSDMAAQAAEFYSNGNNSWEIGSEIVIGSGALRYMDNPTKDCKGRAPGKSCSIDHVKDYHIGLNVHYSSGIFNKVFYLIGTTSGWDARKAFDVMVQANRFYWTPISNFNNAACGVIKATKDYQYSVAAVNKAFAAVGIDTSHC